MKEPEPIKTNPMDDPDFRAFADAWIHLTAWQKKIIVWRALLESIRSRAARFIRSLLTRKE